MTILSATQISLPASAMLSGEVWSTAVGTPVTVTYDFLPQAPTVPCQVVQGDPAETVGWAPLTALQQTEATQAMAAISAVADISFVASGNEAAANILIGTDNQTTSGAYTAYSSGTGLPNGWLMSQDHIEIANNESVDDLTFTAFILHELANATGLEDFVVDKAIPAALNNLSYAVQSYLQYPQNAYFSDGGAQPQTPQILDILAWQYLYGANQNAYTPATAGVTESHVGNNHTYHFTDATSPMTVWIGADVSGVNCFDFSSCSGHVSLDLTPGTVSGTGQYVPTSDTGAVGPATFYQDVGLAYGTTIEVGIGNRMGDTLYADAASGHRSLLIGGEGNDTFVAGDGNDVFVGNGGGGDIVQFHDPYADYKVTAGANGGTLIIDQAAHPTDGTVTLSGGFTQMQFGDGTDINLVQTAADPALSSAVVETAAEISSDLDTLQAGITAGYVHQVILTDSGLPAVQVTAAQSVQDAQALAAISSPYSLVVDMPAGAATAQGPGKGIATTVVLPDTAAHYSIAVGSNGQITLTNGAEVDHLSAVTALQFSDYTVLVASTTPMLTGGVSSAQIASLYAGTLARTPDAGGLAFYENQAAQSANTGIVGYAEYFLSSTEYSADAAHDYAQTAAGDQKFIADIYQNLLNRAPEAGAVAWYETNVVAPILQGVTPGTTGYASAELLAHATVLSYFSQSPEFLGDVSVTAQQPANAQHWLVVGQGA